MQERRQKHKICIHTAAGSLTCRPLTSIRKKTVLGGGEEVRSVQSKPDRNLDRHIHKSHAGGRARVMGNDKSRDSLYIHFLSVSFLLPFLQFLCCFTFFATYAGYVSWLVALNSRTKAAIFLACQSDIKKIISTSISYTFFFRVLGSWIKSHIT